MIYADGPLQMTHSPHPRALHAAPELHMARDLSRSHRRRLLAPLLAGKVVWEADGGEGDIPQPHMEPPPDVVLQLTPVRAELVQRHAASILGWLPEGGIAVLCGEDEVDEAALRRVAPYRAHYTQRDIAGSVMRPAEFDASRITVLRDPPCPATRVHIYLLSRQSLPPLDCGLLELPNARPDAPERPLDTHPLDTKLQKLPPRRPQTGPGAEQEQEQGQAASLAGRLLAQEARLLDALTRLRQAEAAQQNGSSVVDSGRAGPGGAGFEPPSARHSWRLSRQPAGAPLSTNPYDNRVDDAVILAARQGEAFFATYNLGSAAADPGPAVAALAVRVNRLAPVSGTAPPACDTAPPACGTAPPACGTAPDVSIIIPVYGQLAYTLNCLDSLFDHVSRYSAEIIIVDDCSLDQTGDYLPHVPQIRFHRQSSNGGFIASCNTGGALARGSYVVMLNNDTRVVEGWLDALIDSFTRFPRAGLVGSKMLYPDGSLQEAGGILWRDGSAWNYGRDDDPNRPHYAYARQVDYISGCSIALRRNDWIALGGFDAHFQPAYCEDADLCLRVAKGGGEIWFQPQSRVVHYEGKTSGTDTGRGVKAYQVVNTKKLFLRWRDQLATHRVNGEAAYFEKDRKIHQRILVIDATTPTPDQDAGSLQTVLGLESCRALGYGTSFVPEDNFLFQPGYTTSLQAAGIECAYAPYELGMENYLRRYGRLFDAVLVYRVSVLDKILPAIRAHAPQAILLYHVADLHFLRMERQAAIENDMMLRDAAAETRARELALVRTADCTITHSKVEADMLAELAPGAPVTVWPLMYPLHGTTRGFESRQDVIFLGGYRHPPNVDAVRFFCGNILPALREAEPGLGFIAAGANPTAEVAALAAPHVRVTGMIGDLRPVLDAARVFVCPLRVGAGVKGKIMTALAHGIPVVSTTIGIEGSGLVPGKHVLVADDPRDFAAATLRLYREPGLWRDLSEAGLELMAQTFSPARGAAYLQAAIDRAWAHKLGLQAA
jgi:GT2 family glycosyltransferase/glycosyltransferase involved in cell wall biosynthesis